MKYIDQSRHHQMPGCQGVSLISILMTLGLFSIIANFLSQEITRSLKATKSFALSTELEGIKRVILAKTSCEKSFIPHLTCSYAGQIVSLKEDNGSEFISNFGTGTKLGSWTIRAECNSEMDGIIVRTARLKTQGLLTSNLASDFYEDPFTHKLNTWSSSESLLYPSGIEICSSQVSSTLEFGCVCIEAEDDGDGVMGTKRCAKIGSASAKAGAKEFGNDIEFLRISVYPKGHALCL